MTFDPSRPRLSPKAVERASTPPGVTQSRLNGAAESRRALVRAIAADPDNIEWLRAHTATHLMAAAQAVELEYGTDAADTVRRYAAAHRRGDTALW